MRFSRFGSTAPLARLGAAIVPLGLTLALGLETSALAQPKPAPTPAPAPAPATPPPATPAKPAPPAKPLTEAQKKTEAKKAFEEGGKKFDAGDYAAAYDEFKKADDLVPGAVPKFRMAEAVDKQGDVPGAMKAYQAFLDSNPAKEKFQSRIDLANQRLDALKKSPADVKVTVTPPNATLSVDGTAQKDNPLHVTPGKHVVSAKADGFSEATSDVEVGPGEKKEISLTLQPKPAEVAKTPTTPTTPATPTKPEKPEAPHKPSKIPAIITLSLAGAGAVVGAVFGGLALKSKSDFNKTPTQDLYDQTERNALIADMSFGVAITFGVTGIVLLVTSNSEEAPEKKASNHIHFGAAPWASPHGGGAVGVVTF
jgi:hypothetical protein